MARSNNASSTTTKTRTARAAQQAIGNDDAVQEKTATGFEEVYKRFEEAREGLFEFFATPSWKRTLVALVTTLAVALGVGWIAGTVLDWMVAGAMLMAVPTFLVIATWAIGALAVAWYGGKFAVRCGGAVLTGEADERAIAAYDAVKNALKRFNPFVKMQPVKA